MGFEHYLLGVGICLAVLAVLVGMGVFDSYLE